MSDVRARELGARVNAQSSDTAVSTNGEGLDRNRAPSYDGVFDSIVEELDASSSPRLDLGIAIPMYRERDRISATVAALAASPLADSGVGIWFVDDGSTDDTVRVLHDSLARCGLSNAQVLALGSNRGKGAAVRTGVLEAAKHCRYVGFLDADLSLDPADVVAAFVQMRVHDVDAVIGDRVVDLRHQPPLRRVSSVVFRSVANALVETSVRDSQCAMKLFRREVAQTVFSAMTTDGFAFDVELLARLRATGARVREVPIRWEHQRGSQVNALSDGLAMLRDVYRIRRVLREQPTLRGASMPVARSSV